MKKSLIFCIAFIIISLYGRTQSIEQFNYLYYDAIELKQFINNEGKIEIDSNNQERVLNILLKYIDKKDPLTAASIKNYFDPNALGKPDPNAFINLNISKLHSGSEQKFSFSDKNMKSLSSIITSAGGIDVTTIADGFAKFIVKRTKQELSITFFEKFKNDLENYPEIQTIFPNTYKALLSISDDIYMYEAYLQTLKESFKRDLTSLPSNLPNIVNNNEEYFNNVPELKAELLTSFYLAKAIQDKQHPGKIIEDYPVFYLDSVDNNIKGAFQTLQLFSTSLKGNNNSTYWVSNSEIKMLVNDTTSLKIYLGLILQTAKNNMIAFNDKNGTKVYLSDVMNKYYKKANEYKPFIFTIATKTQQLENKINGLKYANSDSLMFENYYSVVSTLIDLMRYAVQADKLPALKDYNLKLEDKTKKYFNIAQSTADIGIDVNRRNYASAIVNGAYILNQAFDSTYVNKFIKKKYPDLSEKKQSEMIASYTNASAKLFKYGSFMAAVAQAKSSEEVEAAIEAIALPTGSSRIKRESKFNVSLNAYCGGFAGEEKIKGVNNWEWNSYGVTAPIGLTVSRGHSIFFLGTGKKGWKNKKYGWSSSLFLSVVDLGAITAFRFTNDSINSVPNIQLKDIISPGIFYSLGIPKTPISLNVGWQVGPLLRKITAETNTYSDKYMRFSISVCVDIPILNMATSSK